MMRTFFLISAGLILAPLLPGIINKVKAFFAGRKGPSVFQLYYDLAKLSHKGVIYSRTTTPVFRLAPLAGLAVLLMTMTLLYRPAGFTGDALLFLYLLGFSRMLTVLAALDTGSSFEGMGASREIQFAFFSEIALFAILAFLAMRSASVTLNAMLAHADWLTGGTSFFLIALSFFVLLLAENCRLPVDDPDTHLELTMIHEAMILDYSGPDLGLIHYNAALKLWLFASFFILLLVPETAAWWILIPGVFLTAVLVGIVESSMSRYRFLKVPQFLIGALALALAAILLWSLFPEGGMK